MILFCIVLPKTYVVTPHYNPFEFFMKIVELLLNARGTLQFRNLKVEFLRQSGQ